MTTNNLIKGAPTAKSIDESTKYLVSKIFNMSKRKPTLVIFSVGNDPASEVYIKHKLAAGERVGINVERIKFPEDISESTLLMEIRSKCRECTVNGLIVQFPLPPHISVDEVRSAIDPKKDVDGLSWENTGKLGNPNVWSLEPCTPAGIMDLLWANYIDVSGKHVVIVGRSNIVGKPLAALMLASDATVTVCHSKTVGLENMTRMADILVVAVGTPRFIIDYHVTPNTVIIDVGINRVDGKLVGDVDLDGIMSKVPGIQGTPVPGGVGPLTVASLMYNTAMVALNSASREFYEPYRLSQCPECDVGALILQPDVGVKCSCCTYGCCL